MVTALNSAILPGMKLGCATRRWAVTVAILGIARLALVSSSAADSLKWSKEKNSVDADISSWSLVQTLEAVAEASGWQIFLEPGTKKSVSTKFKERSRDRALDMLLGNLGRALLPGTNGGPPRLLVFRTKERDATQLIRARKRAKPIPDELIVRMKKGKSVKDVADKLGAKVLGTSDQLNAGRLKFENEEAANKARESLAENSDVESTDPNFPVLDQPALDNSAASGSTSLNLKPLKDGDPLIVGLIDTAVQKTGGAYDDFLLPGISVAEQSAAASGTEQPMHGTSMFEVLLKSIDAFSNDGVTSPVKVLPVDVFGSGGATTFEVTEGIAQALKNGARIINLSLGSEGDTPFLRNVIQQGSAAGAIFVASAGNTPTDAPTFPAGYPEVISVTAGESPTSLASYANFSAVNDAMAPGAARIQYGGLTWIVNGTSPAAAYFSGAVAVGVSGGQTPAQAAQGALRAFPLPPSTRTSAP